MCANKDIQETFSQVGQEWDLSEELFRRLEEFTCLFYAPKSSVHCVNDLRYHLFCVKKGEVDSHQLPPCRDCLKKHSERANYQAAISRRCLQNDPKTPTPVGRGWKLEKHDEVEQLVVDWMAGQPAPQAVLDLLACNCNRSCKLPTCGCCLNNLKCTDMCRLPACDNLSDAESDENHADSDSDHNMCCDNCSLLEKLTL